MSEKFLSDKFFSRLETLALHLQANLSGYYGGKHQIKKYGQTMEFADFRRYELGDDIRRIDWNLFARLKKYFLKLYTDERQMHVQIFLDCSASMASYPEKAKYAISLAAALGFLAVRNMDKVSFHLLKEGKAEDPFGIIVGKNKFFGAIGQLEKIKFEGEADFAASIPRTPHTGTNDGLSIIISDFFTDNDWKAGINYLLYKRRQVLMLQVLTREERDPLYSGRFNLIDSESQVLEDYRNLRIRISRSMLEEYSETVAEEIENITRFCVSRGITFLSFDTEERIEKAIFKKLLQADLIN